MDTHLFNCINHMLPEDCVKTIAEFIPKPRLFKISYMPSGSRNYVTYKTNVTIHNINSVVHDIAYEYVNTGDFTVEYMMEDVVKTVKTLYGKKTLMAFSPNYYLRYTNSNDIYYIEPMPYYNLK